MLEIICTVFSLNSIFLSSPPKPSLWPGGRESKLPPWTQPGQEEVWDWICKSISLTVSPHVYTLWCHFVLTPWTSHFPHSTRAMLPLACQSSTWETPSWAAASWVWPTPWPTPASPCLCTFFFINTLSSQLFLCEMESINADVVVVEVSCYNTVLSQEEVCVFVCAHSAAAWPWAADYSRVESLATLIAAVRVFAIMFALDKTVEIVHFWWEGKPHFEQPFSLNHT